MASAVFKSAFRSPSDTNGVRPVVFDILGPDGETSILPGNLRLVLHVNPSRMSFTYAKVVERIQTRGGWVEQHWGEGARAIDFDMVTGGFMRVGSGMSNITGGDATRRDTIAYDKFLDLLALFHNNGAIYDSTGKIVFYGKIKITYDGGSWTGWFQTFQVTEDATRPFLFALTANFIVDTESLRLRSGRAA